MAFLGITTCFKVAPYVAGQDTAPAEGDAAWQVLRGTQVGFTIDGEEFNSDPTFGCDQDSSNIWATTSITGRSWNVDFQGKMAKANAGEEIVATAGMDVENGARVWVKWYPFGQNEGDVHYYGLTVVQSYNPNTSSTSELVYGLNFVGDGALYREPIPAVTP